MQTIALVGPYGNDVVPLFRKSLGPDFLIESIPTESEFGKLKDADYLVVRVLSMPRAVIEAMPRVKLIQRWGVGFDKVDIVAAGERGIPVAIAPGGNASPVSELALLLMLALYRNLIALHSGILAGDWDKQKFIDNSFMLRGKTLGLVGCGAIGAQVAKKAKAFGAELLYFDARRLPESVEKELGLNFAALDQLLGAADIVSLHLPLTESTRNLIGAREFSLMKPSAILINTSRGEILSTDALVRALKEKKIAGAGLDVFDPEPLPSDSPLLSLPNVVMTPHVGGNTADMSIDMVDICSKNILAISRGESLATNVLVNGQYLENK